jgi:hypothetical protein
MKATTSQNDLHPGITMHSLPVGAGFPGLLFAVGSAAIFLIALPQLWSFLLLAGAMGVTVATILHFAHR